MNIAGAHVRSRWGEEPGVDARRRSTSNDEHDPYTALGNSERHLTNRYEKQDRPVHVVTSPPGLRNHQRPSSAPDSRTRPIPWIWRGVLALTQTHASLAQGVSSDVPGVRLTSPWHSTTLQPTAWRGPLKVEPGLLWEVDSPSASSVEGPVWVDFYSVAASDRRNATEACHCASEMRPRPTRQTVAIASYCLLSAPSGGIGGAAIPPTSMVIPRRI